MAPLHKIKRKKGIAWRIDYRLDDKFCSEYLPVGTTKNEREVVLEQFNQRLRENRLFGKPFVSPLKDTESPLLLNEFEKWFFENKLIAERHGSKIDIKTVKSYKHAFNVLHSAIGNVDLSDVPRKIREIESYIGDRYGNKNSISVVIRALRAAWNFGMQRGIVESNPFLKIPVSKEKKVAVVLTKEEKDRIYENIENDEVKLGFSLARYSGMRRCEICRNVRWESVDWNLKIIWIARGKTGESQPVHIVPILFDILHHHKKDTGFICSMHEDSLMHALKKAMSNAGIQKPGAVKILRHSYAYGLMADNANIRFIQDAMRHDSVQTTQIYTRLPLSDLEKFLDSKQDNL